MSNPSDLTKWAVQIVTRLAEQLSIPITMVQRGKQFNKLALNEQVLFESLIILTAYDPL